MIPRGDWLCAVSYPGEIHKNANNSVKTKIENILTHWSVAQAGSNDEKTGGRKSRWTVPFNSRRKNLWNILICALDFYNADDYAERDSAGLMTPLSWAWLSSVNDNAVFKFCRNTMIEWEVGSKNEKGSTNWPGMALFNLFSFSNMDNTILLLYGDLFRRIGSAWKNSSAWETELS